MSGRLQIIMLVMALLGGTLFACGPSPTPKESIVITFACETLQSEYKRLAREFLVEHPEITVQVLDMRTAMGLKRSAPWPQDWPVRLAQAADTALIYTWPYALQEDSIYDLTPFIEADKDALLFL